MDFINARPGCHPALDYGDRGAGVLTRRSSACTRVRFCVQPCRPVSGNLVGKMSAVLPIRKFRARTRTTENRPEQAFRGSPGLDRTADTRFRKHAEGVTSRGAPCAKVLHGPRFWMSPVMGHSQACRSVVRRFVGIASAATRTTHV
jgi:hypothetical protein